MIIIILIFIITKKEHPCKAGLESFMKQESKTDLELAGVRK